MTKFVGMMGAGEPAEIAKPTRCVTAVNAPVFPIVRPTPVVMTDAEAFVGLWIPAMYAMGMVQRAQDAWRSVLVIMMWMPSSLPLANIRLQPMWIARGIA